MRSVTGAPLPGAPATLVDALKAGRVIAIVGSGVDRASGLPDWGGLIAALADEAERLCPNKAQEVQGARDLLQGGQYLVSASVLKDVLGPEFARTVKRLIVDVRVPSLSHQILMQLPFRAIVTTNYSQLLEFASPPGHFPSVLYWSDPDLPARVRDGGNLILKLHGDIQRPETIVLAREDYGRCLNNERTRDVLKALFIENIPFFVGYGHRDPDLDTLLDYQSVRLGLDGGFALASEDNIAMNTRLRNANVFPIQVASHADVPGFLQSLGSAAGIQSKLWLTVTINRPFTTLEAGQQLGSELAGKLAGLGYEVSVSEVRPGSVVVVIEMPGIAAVDIWLRVHRRDHEIVMLLQRLHVVAVDHVYLANPHQAPQRRDFLDSVSDSPTESYQTKSPAMPQVWPAWAGRLERDEYGVFADLVLAEGVVTCLRWIPPGRFLMGSPKDETGRGDWEGAQLWVTLTQGYWLADAPCTQAEWEAVMGTAPSQFKGPDRPVEQVSWEECQEYCSKLRARFPGLAARLPSEAEWEYACRAGTTTAFNDRSACTQPEGLDPALAKLGWFYENSGNETHPVRKLEPNQFGLYDMHGNVWEWCEDWHGPYAADEQTDPVGAPTGSERVLRGGSWDDRALYSRSAYRYGWLPSVRSRYLGFRLASGQ